MKMTRTTADKIKEPQINITGNRPKNTPVKHIGKKKSLSTIVDLLRQPQLDIRRMLMETNIVFSALHLMQISSLFWEDTSRLMKAP